jgi:hypothetical protein
MAVENFVDIWWHSWLRSGNRAPGALPARQIHSSDRAAAGAPGHGLERSVRLLEPLTELRGVRGTGVNLVPVEDRGRHPSDTGSEQYARQSATSHAQGHGVAGTAPTQTRGATEAGEERFTRAKKLAVPVRRRSGKRRMAPAARAPHNWPS